MTDGTQGALFGPDAARLGRDLIDEGLASDIAIVRGRLAALWTEPAIDVWLTSANAHLDGARPCDVLALEGLAAVVEAVDVEVAGGSR
ncbi:antitoxin Xre/MbcA/ParS toxin-binding domain-containing protein [Microbacterium sp. CJ88]|uniref:antitoxin Xre/MbcA/ParS toxin-binding domain-containing protein n=1 Tax=Microbacterium sp. CJ88 TaxID=3445672 RepID=UPI003F656054